MTGDSVAVSASRAAFNRACAALDELIILALTRGPMKKQQLRTAVPFSDTALDAALGRLLTIGEIAAEGQTRARVYRLVQLRSTPGVVSTPAGRRSVISEGVEFEPIWPLASDPKAPPTALNREAAR
jgi:hypothetical protein